MTISHNPSTIIEDNNRNMDLTSSRILQLRDCTTDPPIGKKSKISPREKDVIRLLCTGYTSKEIAERLNVSPYTIVSHIKNIKEKLGAKNTTHAVVKYLSVDYTSRTAAVDTF